MSLPEELELHDGDFLSDLMNIHLDCLAIFASVVVEIEGNGGVKLCMPTKAFWVLKTGVEHVES